MNTFFIRGNIINPPELKYTPAGLPILTLTLAGGTAQRRWYHKTALYGAVAEILADTPVDTLAALHCNVQQRESNNGFKYSNLVANEVRLVHRLPSDEMIPDVNGNKMLIAESSTMSSFGMISGNITRDPRVTNTTRGRVANASVAINEFVKGETLTTYMQISAFDDHPAFESIADLSKGQYVIAQGTLVVNRWTDNDGRNRYDPNLLADTIILGQKNGLGVVAPDRGVRPKTPLPDRLVAEDEFPPDSDLPF